jgi:hypothetical protein
VVQGFTVGANFPWVNCGWDFGAPPAGWRRDPARSWAWVEEQLRALRALGVRVVRFWVLAGGVNYPVGRDIADIAERRGLVRRHWRLRPGALLPALGSAFTDDFAKLLAACRAAEVKLVPSLVSFEWFAAERAGSRGRRELVFGDGANLWRAIDAFLAATLEPLLAAAQPYRDAVFAFETVNEPDWVVHGGPLLSPVLKSVEANEMNGFIRRATERIASAGFVATTGFKALAAPWVRDDTWEVLRRQAERGAYVHQLHHYPVLGSTVLGPASSSPLQPVVVGEFPTAPGRFGTPANQRWGNAEVRASERDPGRYLEGRLALIRSLGYAGAWLWNAYHPDPRSLWSAQQRQQVERFSS